MNTSEAIRELFNNHSNKELAEMMGVNYNTLTSWKFSFRNGQLSLEKQIEILFKTNHSVKSNLLWQKKVR